MRVFPHLIQHHRLAVVRDGKHAREVVPCVLGDVSTTSIRVELMGMMVKRAAATTGAVRAFICAWSRTCPWSLNHFRTAAWDFPVSATREASQSGRGAKVSTKNKHKLLLLCGRRGSTAGGLLAKDGVLPRASAGRVRVGAGTSSGE